MSKTMLCKGSAEKGGRFPVSEHLRGPVQGNGSCCVQAGRSSWPCYGAGLGSLGRPQFGSVIPHRRSLLAELGRTPVHLSLQNVPHRAWERYGCSAWWPAPKENAQVHLSILGLLVGGSQPICSGLMGIVQEEGPNNVQVTACSASFRDPT